MFTRHPSCLIACSCLLLLAGCETAVDVPDPPSATGALFEAQLDPAQQTFVIALAGTPGNAAVRAELVGSNIAVDASAGTVSLDVAIRNTGETDLAGAVTVIVRDIRPRGIEPINADGYEVPNGGSAGSVIYDYSAYLGDEGRLVPGELSQQRTWIFDNPELVSFAFVALIDVLAPNPRAAVSGGAFLDRNRNGRREADEAGVFGVVEMRDPLGAVTAERTGRDGRYRIPVSVTGLYRLMFRPADDRARCARTPLVLEVVLTPGPDGVPRGFDGADFAVPPCPDDQLPVVLTSMQPDEIEQDPYRLLEVELDGERLVMRVGFSGCSPDHPFRLFISRDIMESLPPQVWALVAHDDRDELCDAYFERTLVFDLGIFLRWFAEVNRGPGPVIIRLLDFEGQTTRLLYEP